MVDQKKINTRIKMYYRLKLDASPHFKIEGRLEYDSDDENLALRLKEKQSVSIRYRFEYMDCENSKWNEIFDYDITVKLKNEKLPGEVMRTGLFHALRIFLKRKYEDVNSERFLVDTVGFTNYHTFRMISKSEWMRGHTEEQFEVQILKEAEVIYNINNQEIYGKLGNKIGEWDFCPQRNRGEREPSQDLYYDGSHRVRADIDSYADFLDAIGNIPDFFRTYNTEEWQKQEAVRRLRLLGVSEKEIHEFEEKMLIPTIEMEKDGRIKRSEYSEFERELNDFFHNWRFEPVLKSLNGGLPYIKFYNDGKIPMEAWLYVEPLIDDREQYQSELENGSKQLIMSAFVFSGRNIFTSEWSEHEYGSIVIERTDDGPVRTG